MKKDTNVKVSVIVGIDLGDKRSEICVLDAESGEVVERGEIRTTEAALRQRFGSCAPVRVVMETGTHSPWVGRLLEELGHEVVVANARKVRSIYDSDVKSDRQDAEWLARLGRLDVKLLSPVRHRGAQTQADLEVLRARDVLVGARTRLVNHVRGAVKSMGGRLVGCTTENIQDRAVGQVPAVLKEALEPVLEMIARLKGQIRKMDRMMERIARERYPEHELLVQPSGVGTLTAMGFMLTVEDPRRFRRNRAVGAYLGLVPRRSQSGERDPQLRITKAGDRDVRRLLVLSANYILGPFGPETDLKRWGMNLMKGGGRRGKKRAVVAVARRLAVLLLSLWKTGEVYEPLRHSGRQAAGTRRLEAASA